MAHNFICPNCGNRTTAADRNAGFRREARGCSKCGFGFLFELLDDYYPAPDAAFFVSDQEGKLIGAGRGARELTGLDTEPDPALPLGQMRFDRVVAAHQRLGDGTHSREHKVPEAEN